MRARILAASSKGTNAADSAAFETTVTLSSVPRRGAAAQWWWAAVAAVVVEIFLESAVNQVAKVDVAVVGNNPTRRKWYNAGVILRSRRRRRHWWCAGRGVLLTRKRKRNISQECKEESVAISDTKRPLRRPVKPSTAVHADDPLSQATICAD
jgi:hypothetical protein